MESYRIIWCFSIHRNLALALRLFPWIRRAQWVKNGCIKAKFEKRL